MSLVILESPYAAPTKEGVEHNIAYARACLLDSLKKGEAPFASHLLYTQCLDDESFYERQLGMLAGFHWTKALANNTDNKCVVYTDRGISRGMQAGIAVASRYGLLIVFRTLGGSWSADVD